jgi:hypothetical protein
MKYLWIFPYYLGWHYGRGTAETLVVFKNFLFFVPRYFSIGTLFRTLFSPFQRLKENYEGGLEIRNFLEVITVNLIMRLVGLLVRSFFITIGLIALVATFILEIILFVVWLILPFLVVFTFVSSLIAIFKL